MAEFDEDYVNVTADSEFEADIINIPMLNVNDLVDMYVKHRDDLSAETKAYNQRKANRKDVMQRISMALRDLGDQIGVDSFATPSGTAYRNVKEYYRVGNWDSILEYIIQTGNYQMLEKRISKLATREIYQEMGELPPGVEFSAEVEFAVRRPTKRKESNTPK